MQEHTFRDCSLTTLNANSGHSDMLVSSNSILARNGNGSYGTEERQRHNGTAKRQQQNGKTECWKLGIMSFEN